MNKKTAFCAVLALTALTSACSYDIDDPKRCDEGAIVCDGNNVMQCINGDYFKVKTCDVACENAACILCDQSISPTKCEAESYYECTTNRTWNLVKACVCQDEKSCKDNASVPKCENGTVKCDTNVNQVRECVDAAWQLKEECAYGCNGNQCAPQYLIQSEMDIINVYLDEHGKAENLSLSVTYLVNGTADIGHTLLVSTNNPACIAVDTSEVATGNNAVIAYRATATTNCIAELIIKDADGRAKPLTVQVKIWEDSDDNHNHFLDQAETSAPNFGKTCRIDADCDSAEGTGDGFCDSFSDFTCTKRCTSNDQCVQNVDGFNFVCRQDGRCASDAFVIEWSDQTNIAVMPIDIDAEYDIDWGDGTTEHHSVGSDNSIHTQKHEFKTAGKHVIRVTGNYHFSVNNISNDANLSTEPTSYRTHAQKHLIAVRAFGPVGLQAAAFSSCKSLIALSNVDIPDSTQLEDLTRVFNSAFYEPNEYQYALLPYWDLSHVKNTSSMFNGAINFNADISRWNVANVTDMNSMFYGAHSFNQDIGAWNVANVTNMASMFNAAKAFNQNIGAWNVANVTDMNNMFNGASNFNQDLNDWKTGNVLDMNNMFNASSAFNGKISNWDVSKVTDMKYMFRNASAFNQDISTWNVSKVKNMYNMFSQATSFNQDLNAWNVQAVLSMNSMFRGATAFNGNILNWQPTACTNMENMFDSATAFSHDIGDWPIPQDVSTTGMFTNTSQTMQEIVDSWKTRTCNKDAMTLSCLFQTSDAN